jgi:transcriptional regulator with XRE-family HTH domain
MLVGSQLRRLREAQGIARDTAGAAIRASATKIGRLERGRTGFKEPDVADLLTLYGVTDQTERQAILGMAEQANTPGWWTRYHDVIPNWFEPFLGLELAANIIRGYEVQFIPGLLQTEDYARSVIRLGNADDTESRLQRRVSLRMRRQDLLTRPDPPQLWVVIDETALRRPVGNTATQRAQLRHLMEIAELPNVTIQIIPFRAGGHSAGGGPITLLRFDEDQLPDVVYLEQLTTAVYVDKAADTAFYRDVLNRLSMQAEPPAATKALLHQTLVEI